MIKPALGRFGRRGAPEQHCTFCQKPDFLQIAITDSTNKAGQKTRNVYFYHTECLEAGIARGDAHAIQIIEASKKMDEDKKKRREFMEKHSKSAAQWYYENKEKINDTPRKKDKVHPKRSRSD